MRPITQILLLIVVAFIAYLIWPRTPDMKHFDPAQLAKLTIEDWRSQADNKDTAGVIARYKIYAWQFHFSPVAAFRMAQNQGVAVAEIKRLKAENAEGGGDETKALMALTEKYAAMKRQVQGDTDSDALARDELAWVTLLLGGSPANEVAAPIARILAAFYGGDPQDFTDVATNLAYAQGLIFTGQTQGPEGQSAEDYAREGFKLLKEVANTPVTAPAPR